MLPEGKPWIFSAEKADGEHGPGAEWAGTTRVQGTLHLFRLSRGDATDGRLSRLPYPWADARLEKIRGRKRMGKGEPIRAELKEQGYSLPSTHGAWI